MSRRSLPPSRARSDHCFGSSRQHLTSTILRLLKKVPLPTHIYSKTYFTMAGKQRNKAPRGEQASPAQMCDVERSAARADGDVQDNHGQGSIESRKIGIPGAVFLILNKRIGTGSTSQRQSIDLVPDLTDPRSLLHAIRHTRPNRLRRY